MGVYNFIFNTRTGLAILIFGGMALFAVVAAVLERGTRARYRDRPAPPEDDDELDYEDDEPAARSRSGSGKSREERLNEGLDKLQEKVNEGGLIGAMGISMDDDDDDDDDDDEEDEDEERDD